MRWFRADIHIHSVLSPCGDLDMSPARIIHEAKNKKLDIIGITDHNSTKHAELMMKLGEKAGIKVIPGIEVNTLEEIHCLAFFENIEKTKAFQDFIDQKLVKIENVPDKFGQQLLVNEKEEILEEEKWWLNSTISATVNEVEEKVHKLAGVFIPAHVLRPSNGIYSQIGFIPQNLLVDAIEISSSTLNSGVYRSKKDLENYTIITGSDAHYPHIVGSSLTKFFLSKPTLNEIRMALKNKGGRKTRLA
ncbi:MAG: PHP domain-containing protein [Bacteroidales bacterium]|nr:PHP domain-containing protein [Bacteroidales bacterium]MBN2819002.1 PHP domain-containing protein [Bacteroidales bacterium]